jgi:hypothetical protein
MPHSIESDSFGGRAPWRGWRVAAPWACVLLLACGSPRASELAGVSAAPPEAAGAVPVGPGPAGATPAALPGGSAGEAASDVAGAGGAAQAGRGGASPAEAAGRGGSPDNSTGGPVSGESGAPVASEPFSFFVTSLRAMRELSGSEDGFGGDLRFGEIGEGAGLRGADKICATIAEQSMPGAGQKQWRAFLSATTGGEAGGVAHAIDRIGAGPWYDRAGRLVAEDMQQLIGTRPANADPTIENDLPNEDGLPNHNPDGSGEVDNHDTLTGSNGMGMLASEDPRLTCSDWTNAEPDPADSPQVGHSWGRDLGGGGFGPNTPGAGSGAAAGGGYNPNHWIEAHAAPGCAPGVGLSESSFPDQNDPTVGGGGGYGGIYCFALTP